MVKILEKNGARCYVGCFDATEPSDFASEIPFQKFIYGSIESGYPAIIVFGVSSRDVFHAIPVIGHTFNQDNWVPRAERGYFKIGPEIRYIPSDAWLSMFICHDDNFGSNYCIPKHYLHTGNAETCKKCKKEQDQLPHQACVCYVIGTQPQDIKINPIEAEAIGADFLFELKKNIPFHTDNEWIRRLDHSADENKLVLRPILIKSKEYIEHLLSVTSWDYKKIDDIFIEILKESFEDEWFWLVELSLSELFAANKRKVGEVLIRATEDYDPKRRFDSFLLARLPGFFVFYDEKSAAFTFIPSGINDHTELFGQESSSEDECRELS